MKRLLFPILVLVVLILVGTFVYQAVSGPPKLLQMPETDEVIAPPAQLPKVKEGFEWSAMDEAELNEMLQSLNGDSQDPVRREEFSIVLAPGESLITDGFEKEPGVFEFSQLSAELKTGDHGEGIFISAKRLEVTVGGSERILSMPRVWVLPGTKASIESGVQAPDGKMLGGFKLEILADSVEGGISLQGVEIEH